MPADKTVPAYDGPRRAIANTDDYRAFLQANGRPVPDSLNTEIHKVHLFGTEPKDDREIEAFKYFMSNRKPPANEPQLKVSADEYLGYLGHRYQRGVGMLI